jgi:hypothetical protein
VKAARLFVWCLSSGLCFAQTLIFEHVTVIDATGAAPLKNVNVAITADRISAIQSKTIRHPRGAVVIDAKGRFLIPGLWDMHMHLGRPDIFFPLLVANGITGVREMYTGTPMRVIRQWRQLRGAPRIVAPGFLDGPSMLTTGPAPPDAIAVATPAQGRIAVHLLAEDGVDFLKVYSSLPRDAFLAIASEARAIGIPFAGHVPEAVSPLEASAAGQRSQEHLMNILLACSTNEEELRKERVATMLSGEISGEERMRLLAWPKPEGLFDTYDETKAAALFEAFVKNGTWQTPTLSLLTGFLRVTSDDFIHDARLRYIPRAWTATWDPRAALYSHDLSPEGYQALRARIQSLLDRYKKLVGDMHRSGVEFLAGTDTNQTNPMFPGWSLHEELELLVESGLSPMEALQSATRNPAMYFGQIRDLGTVEAGKLADLVLLDADPLADIHNTRTIDAVVMGGHYYSRRDLDAALETASTTALTVH